MRKLSPLHFSALALLAMAFALALSACGAASTTVPEPLAAIQTSTPVPPTDLPAATAVVAATAAPLDLPTNAAPTAAPAVATAETPAPWVSYIGADENVWIINPARGEMRQVTQDAVPFQPGLIHVQYCCGVWSPDGQYLAYSRQVGTPVAEGGYNYNFGLWVFDIASGQSREVLAQQTNGFSWRPGTHTITYGLNIRNEYFNMQHGVNSTFANGIWGFDLDTGAAQEIVPPSRGFTLVNPIWVPNGRFVGFDEVYQMEGRGKFAYFDPVAGEYYAWDKAIGGYQWSPDGENLYYDYLTYAPSGTERIFRNDINNSVEAQISPDPTNGIAFSPLLTPDGSQVIYSVEEMNGDGTSRYQLMIIPAEGGEPRVLGQFDQPGELTISADGSLLLLATGPYDSRQIQMVNLLDGSARSLVQGRQPQWQR